MRYQSPRRLRIAPILDQPTPKGPRVGMRLQWMGVEREIDAFVLARHRWSPDPTVELEKDEVALDVVARVG